MFSTLRRLSSGTAKYFNPKTYVVVEMRRDVSGELARALNIFSKYHINISSLETRLNSYARQGPTFHIDFDGDAEDPKIKQMLLDLRLCAVDLEVMKPRRVPWFPINIRDLDSMRNPIEASNGEDGGLENPDHPGFSDPVYLDRRKRIVQNAAEHKHGNPIPRVEYTPEENRVWGLCLDKLRTTHRRWACEEYLRAFDKLELQLGMSDKEIPQLEDLSNFLQQQTGFTLKPVPGLLSARDFLNSLAFRVFYSTQYIRHHGNPFYTPEPDVVHELVGHVPLFADPDFADFSQEIGLASLGASDEDILRLSSVYWFTVEFGLMTPKHLNGERKVYGAGILSSFGEMEWSCHDAPSGEVREAGGMARDYPDLGRPKVVPFNPFVAATQMYPITTYQPLYFGVPNFHDLKVEMSKFVDSMAKPFRLQYDPITQSVRPDKHLARLIQTDSGALQAAKQKEYFDSLKANFRDHGVTSAEVPL